MLLIVYLGTTAFVWFTTFKSIHDMDKRLKKEGYKFNVKKFNGLGDIALGGILLIAMSIPIVQLIFPISNLDKGTSYDEYKNMLLDAGSIKEPDQEVINKIYEIEPKTINNSDIIKQKIVKKENFDYEPYIPEYRDESDILDSGHTLKKVLNNRKK